MNLISSRKDYTFDVFSRGTRCLLCFDDVICYFDGPFTNVSSIEKSKKPEFFESIFMKHYIIVLIIIL